MNIKNKTVFITGGGAGIGLATAKKLFEEGAKVAVYSLNTNEEEVKKEIAGNNAGREKDILVINGDVMDREKVAAALKAAGESLGPLGILINNAGAAHRKNFEETDEKEWDFILNVNFKGTLIVTQEALKVMEKEKGEKMIINISSGAGLYGVKGLSIYSAAKAGIIAFTQALAGELNGTNIKAVTITPGSVGTDMFKSLFPDEKPHHTPEEVAGVIYKTITGKIEPDHKLIVDTFYHTR